MTTVTEPSPPDVRDYTLTRPPFRFRIDNDEFAAPAVMSLVLLRRARALQRTALPSLAAFGDPDATDEQIDAAVNAVQELFQLLLPGESGQRFAARLVDPDQPIDLVSQAMPILNDLMEHYGLRPTQPSPPSSTSSTATGSEDTSSTDGASPEASTNAT